MPDTPAPVPVDALVASSSPVMLAGGRPAAPGEEVDADLHADGHHFASGALRRLPDRLEALQRDELDARARDAGVEDPQKLPNKAAVVAAIHAAHSTED
ncbi:hypothetical protein [Patulibacter sp. SYSU D01012]|uniref:hypothetical protein n=1 Tax=Patulibacter sp. SYSU D01012 TaxID=2817381 RepID=UPI001B300A96|nr:hypothetical protein [Patulibacter sp. SYSU D01012]